MIDFTPLILERRRIGSIRGLIARWLLERHNQLASIGVRDEVVMQLVADYREWMWSK